jgi:hypothetical protein
VRTDAVEARVPRALEVRVADGLQHHDGERERTHEGIDAGLTHTPSPRVHTGCFRALRRGLVRTRADFGPGELLGIFPRFRQLHTNIMRV